MKQMVDNVYAELARFSPDSSLIRTRKASFEGFRPAVKSSWFRLSIDTLVTLSRFCVACVWTK